jgi:uncharacterized protein YukE
MFASVINWFATLPSWIIKSLKVVGVYQMGILTNAVVYYHGKPIKVFKAVGTLGYTLIRDSINEAKNNEAAIASLVDSAVAAQHGTIQAEYQKALTDLREASTKLNDVLKNLDAATTPVAAPAEQLHVELKS